MAKMGVEFNGRRALAVSGIVILIYLFGLIVIYFGVKPIDTKSHPNAINSMSFLAAVLALLAGGCIAGFLGFKYEDVELHEKRSMVFTAYLLIGGIFILVFLSLYCLRKICALSHMNLWELILLFLATYAVLNAIVLLERWDATQLPKQ
jgi:hypothetical protein